MFFSASDLRARKSLSILFALLSGLSAIAIAVGPAIHA